MTSVEKLAGGLRSARLMRVKLRMLFDVEKAMTHTADVDPTKTHRTHIAWSQTNVREMKSARQAMVHVGGEKRDGFRCAAPILRLAARLISYGSSHLQKRVRPQLGTSRSWLAQAATRCSLVLVLAVSGFNLAKAFSPIPLSKCNGTSEFWVAIRGPMPTVDEIEREIPISVATQMEIYTYPFGMILGPRKWRCQISDDQDGGFPTYRYTVTILPPVDNLHQYGIAVILIDGSANSHSQELLAPWANAYFSSVMKNNTLRGYGPISSFALKKYGTDLLRYDSSLLVSYMTPADHQGVGDEIVFQYGYGVKNYNKDGSLVYSVLQTSITGFIELFNYPGKGAEGLELFAVSLPPWNASLTSYIKDYAEKNYNN